MNIEISLFNSESVNSKSLSSVNKQAWLHSLEQAELANALKKTHVIQTGVKDYASNSSNSSSENGGSDSITIQEESSNEYSAVVVHSDAHSSSTMMADQEIRYLPLNIIEQQVQGLHIGLRLSNESVDIKLKALALSNSLPKPVVNSDLEWAIKNLVALRSTAGLEIWVRDASLTTNSRVMDALNDLRKNMANLGASLVKVIVNGKEVYSTQQSLNSNVV